MKTFAALLALSAVHGGAAFSVPSPAMLRQSSTALGMAAWDMKGSTPQRVEGMTRKTWSFTDNSQEVVEVVANSNGRPVHADMELWIGPNWTPFMLKAYSEDGQLRPIQTLIGTRSKTANIEVRNVGPSEFPFTAGCKYAEAPQVGVRSDLLEGTGRYVEGGSVYSLDFDPSVEQVQVLLKTDSRQLNCKIELLNGPNNIKQHFEVFTNNGVLNSLYVVFKTPGSGNVVRVTNIAPLEFPCEACISAY